MQTSVIIVSYNGMGYLADCLAALMPELRQDEVILVDNASSDGSADFIRENYPQVRLVCNDENRGFAAACNQGAALAGGAVLVFLNQDTRVAPGWLAPLVTGLAQDTQTGLTTSKVLLMSDPGKIHLCGQDIHYTGLVTSRDYGTPASDFNTPAVVGAVSGASFAIRRALWEQLGGFDEAFFMYYEETDLCWRAQLAGYRCVCVPGSVVWHDYRPGQANAASHYYSMRNRHLVLLKNWGCGTLLLLWPALLLAAGLKWAIDLHQGRLGLGARLRAGGWLARNLGAVLRQRQQAQALRTVPDWQILSLRACALRPVETPLSPTLRSLLAPLNALFCLYQRGTVCILKALGW